MSWRSLKHVLSGSKNLTKGQRTAQAVALVCVLWAGCFLGYCFGYQDGTGTLPFGPEGKSIVPPEITKTTSADVLAFVGSDETNLEQYREGFNCVEFALVAARNAWWQEVPACPIKIDFENGDTHMILGFPTEDEGWMFLSPQGDLFVKPRVGGKFCDKTIVGLSYLYDLVWRPIEVTR